MNCWNVATTEQESEKIILICSQVFNIVHTPYSPALTVFFLVHLKPILLYAYI